jgi:hypothetical protein
MFLKKKKEEKKVTSWTAPNGVVITKDTSNCLRNLDGWNFFDTDKGEFRIDMYDRAFDFEQQKILRLLIDHKVPCGAIAYIGLPSNYMEEIRSVVLPQMETGIYKAVTFDEAELYKITHTDLDIEQFRYCLKAMMNDVYICDEIENVSIYPPVVFMEIAKASEYELNVCNMVSPDMDMQLFVEDVKRKIKKIENKGFVGDVIRFAMTEIVK